MQSYQSVVDTAPSTRQPMWPLTPEATQTLDIQVNTEVNTEVNTQEPASHKTKRRSWTDTLRRGSKICCCFPSSTRPEEATITHPVSVPPTGTLQPRQEEERCEASANDTTDNTRPLSYHSIVLPVQGVRVSHEPPQIPVQTFGEALSSYEEEGGRPFSLQLPIQGAQQRFPRDSIDYTIDYGWETMESQNQPESTTDLGLDPETAAILSKSFHPPTSPPPPRPPRSSEIPQTSTNTEDPLASTYSPRTPQRSTTNLTRLTVPPIPEEITEAGSNEPVSSPSSELPQTKSMGELHSARTTKRRVPSTSYETNTVEEQAMYDAIMDAYPEEPDTPEGSEHGGGLEMRRTSSTGRFRPPPIFIPKDSGDSTISLPHIGPHASGDGTRANLILTRTNSAESTQSVERVTRTGSRASVRTEGGVGRRDSMDSLTNRSRRSSRTRAPLPGTMASPGSPVEDDPMPFNEKDKDLLNPRLFSMTFYHSDSDNETQPTDQTLPGGSKSQMRETTREEGATVEGKEEPHPAGGPPTSSNWSQPLEAYLRGDRTYQPEATTTHDFSGTYAKSQGFASRSDVPPKRKATHGGTDKNGEIEIWVDETPEASSMNGESQSELRALQALSQGTWKADD
ncbi:hypothetical protein M231_04501 [Tremella mesenterica]|uniref:Uncharacterized protein n=1 Tax=Tremella mesenterica TaxID=5217 RepID=A0A4V1M3V8_TREME|nr:hypothetical protein M231_04501 [Tremella mesenterica]